MRRNPEVEGREAGPEAEDPLVAQRLLKAVHDPLIRKLALLVRLHLLQLRLHVIERQTHEGSEEPGDRARPARPLASRTLT